MNIEMENSLHLEKFEVLIEMENYEEKFILEFELLQVDLEIDDIQFLQILENQS
jgi:hypothetical protein